MNPNARVDLYGREIEDSASEHAAGERPLDLRLPAEYGGHRTQGLPAQGALSVRRELESSPRPRVGLDGLDSAQHEKENTWRRSTEIGTTNDNMPAGMTAAFVPKEDRLPGHPQYADDRGLTASAWGREVATNATGTRQTVLGIGGDMYTGRIDDKAHRNERQDRTYTFLEQLWRTPGEHVTLGAGIFAERWGNQGGLQLQDSVHAVTGGDRGRFLPQHYTDGDKKTTGVGVRGDAGYHEQLNDYFSVDASAGVSIGTQSSEIQGQTGFNLELPGWGTFHYRSTAIKEFDPHGRLSMLPHATKMHIGQQMGIEINVLKKAGVSMEFGVQKNGRAGETVMYVVLRKAFGGGDTEWLPRMR